MKNRFIVFIIVSVLFSCQKETETETKTNDFKMMNFSYKGNHYSSMYYVDGLHNNIIFCNDEVDKLYQQLIKYPKLVTVIELDGSVSFYDNEQEKDQIENSTIVRKSVNEDYIEIMFFRNPKTPFGYMDKFGGSYVVRMRYYEGAVFEQPIIGAGWNKGICSFCFSKKPTNFVGINVSFWEQINFLGPIHMTWFTPYPNSEGCPNLNDWNYRASSMKIWHPISNQLPY